MPEVSPMPVRNLDPTALRRLSRELSSLADALEAGAAPVIFDHKPDLRTWYAQRVRCLVAAGQRASREDDEAAFAAAGFDVTRLRVRELRRELAPPEWSEPGRPRRG